MEEKFKAHKSFYDQPILLSKEQMKKPVGVFTYYFSAVRLHEIRADLAKLQQCALVTDNEYFAEPEQRASIVNALQQLEELVEAAWVLGYKRC